MLPYLDPRAGRPGHNANLCSLSLRFVLISGQHDLQSSLLVLGMHDGRSINVGVYCWAAIGTGAASSETIAVHEYYYMWRRSLVVEHRGRLRRLVRPVRSCSFSWVEKKFKDGDPRISILQRPTLEGE
jgi:sugar (pentulose or hexulose) kinase